MIRLLNAFDVAPITTFFMFTLVKPNGDPGPDLPPFAMFSFVAEQLTYVELTRKESFAVTLFLNQLWNDQIEPGRYTLSGVYRNEYGEDCFNGIVRTNSIDITITPR